MNSMKSMRSPLSTQQPPSVAGMWDVKRAFAAVAVALLAVSGCTTQTNKPPPGPGGIGAIGGDTTLDGHNHSHNGQVHSHANAGPGHQHNGGGTGGRGGAGSGAGNNRSGQYGSNGAGQGGQGGGAYGGGNSGGIGGAGSGYVGGQGGSGYGNGSGGFGGGAGYAGNTKSSYTPADLRDPRSILAQRVIYFEYDKATIQPQYRTILDAHAALLSDFPQLNIRLEGHADERGTREYNVALSERRGFSVLDYLKIKGVKASQADVVGYGEEIPATFGHGENSWSKNRRVEIIYAGE